jgi:hypothetical protein
MKTKITNSAKHQKSERQTLSPQCPNIIPVAFPRWMALDALQSPLRYASKNRVSVQLNLTQSPRKSTATGTKQKVGIILAYLARFSLRLRMPQQQVR